MAFLESRSACAVMMRRLRRVARGGARLELIGRLEEDLGGDDAPLDLAREPLDLRVPAVDLGLELAQDRLGLGEAAPRPP